MPAREHHLPVTRTARYFTLGEPGEGVQQVWFVLHGYGQLAGRFIAHFAELDDGRHLIVAPEALSRFYLGGTTGPHGAESKIGATWMTREDRLAEIDDYVSYLDALYDEVMGEMDPSRVEVTMLGFSQGTATASRWVTRAAARVKRLVLWGGFLPGDLDIAAASARLAALDLTVVLGNQDEFASLEAIAAAKATLQRHGVPYRLIDYDGGHRLHAGTLRSLGE